MPLITHTAILVGYNCAPVSLSIQTYYTFIPVNVPNRITDSLTFESVHTPDCSGNALKKNASPPKTNIYSQELQIT